ncbi:hypothetical protein M153_7345000239 [Pseudoloma neurophilia]|uniref:Uncharacterized protein n=1 Tax=Pseudoloma neurophilia TaxID=146866 RepID=A0A0R0LY50_9MICR|nr:hypothetical protein M153_7345000239 [Pseudoloma neurophilia]
MASRFYLLKKPSFLDIQQTILGLNRASKYEINFSHGRSNTRFIKESTFMTRLTNDLVLNSHTNYLKIGKEFFKLKKVNMNKQLIIVNKTGVCGMLNEKLFVIDNRAKEI